MVSRKPFFKPYTGTLTEDMPGQPSDYVAVETGSHKASENADCWHAWDRVLREAQKLSVNQEYQHGMVTKGLIEPALEAIDRCVVDLRLRRVTQANRLFTHAFGGPGQYAYQDYPILFPAESRWGFNIVHSFLGAAYQLPRLNSNRLDEGIVHRDAMTVVEPLLNLKVQIAKLLFRLEIAGKVSPEELEALFDGLKVQPPVRRVEGQATLAVESADRPAADASDAVRAGMDILVWTPSQEDWDTFGIVQKQEADAGPEQRPPEPMGLLDGGTVITGAVKAASTARSRR